MPRAKRPPAPDPLSEVRARIRSAERQHQPIAREDVGLDAEGYETLATLVERGAGKKGDVLREALRTGLRVMLAGTEVPTTLADSFAFAEPSAVPQTNGKKPHFEDNALLASVVGGPLVGAVVQAPKDDAPEEEHDDSAE